MIVYNGIKLKNLEDVLHLETVEYLKSNYPNVVFQSNHLQGLGFNKKNFNLLKIKKRFNGTVGIPDIIVLHKNKTYGGLVIELKSFKGSVSKEQKIVLENLKKNNFQVFLVGKKETLSQAIQTIKKIIKNYIEDIDEL